jgi:hypothetical protein
LLLRRDRWDGPAQLQLVDDAPQIRNQVVEAIGVVELSGDFDPPGAGGSYVELVSAQCMNCEELRFPPNRGRSASHEREGAKTRLDRPTWGSRCPPEGAADPSQSSRETSDDPCRPDSLSLRRP